MARDNGIALIWNRMNAKHLETGLPALLMGDMNNDRADQPRRDHVVAFLRGQTTLEWQGEEQRADLLDLCQIIGDDDAVGKTYQGFKGGFTGQPSDLIYATPDVKIGVFMVDRRKYSGRYPSDHYAVIGQVAI